MKTIYLHGSPDLYGSGKVMLEILRIPGNAEQAIVVLPHEGPLCKKIIDLKIPLYILNMGVLRRRYLTPWGIVGRLILWFIAVWKIKRIIEQHQAQCIYVNSLNVIIGPWLKLFTSKRLVWHLHEIIEEPKLLFWALQRMIKKADKLIAVSKAVQYHWAHPKLHRPIHVLYNGFSTPNRMSSEVPISNLKETITIGMVGRIQPLKGHSYLLDIFQELIKDPRFKNPANLQLILAGDPYPGYEHLQIQLMEAIKKKKLGEFVNYIGYQENIAALLENIDVLIVPSIKPDSLPTVVIEAMYAGKPVVATRLGGCIEMIEENKTGFFIPLNDPIQSSKMLLSILSDKLQLKKVGEAGKKRAEQLFSIQSFHQGWLRIMNG